MEYIQRLNHFAAARTWRLDCDGISWSDSNGESGRIAYLAVRAVRLRFEPSRAERRRYAMRVFAGREYLITNINYRGFMDFVDESDQFKRFVIAFHERLRQENKNVAYKVGSTHLAYMANLLITLFAVVVLCSAAFYFVSVGLIWLVAIKITFIVFYLPTVFRLLKRNPPGTYDPAQIPTHIIPA